MLLKDPRTSRRELVQRLPLSLQSPKLALSVFTEQSLQAYLDRWSRFALHLQREGVVLYDGEAALAPMLSRDVNVSLTHELDAQRRQLNDFSHLDRFGGRLITPLAHLYRIGRVAVFAELASHGTFVFDRETAFDELAKVAPRLARDIKLIDELAPFYLIVESRIPPPSCPSNPSAPRLRCGPQKHAKQSDACWTIHRVRRRHLDRRLFSISSTISSRKWLVRAARMRH